MGVWLIASLVLICSLVIWLPYRWSALGYHWRKAEGPWLVNFPADRLRLVLIRDLLLTAGLWLGGLMLLRGSSDPLFLLFGGASLACLLGVGVVADRLERYQRASQVLTVYLGRAFAPVELRQMIADLGGMIPGRRQTYHARFMLAQTMVWWVDSTRSYQRRRARLAKRQGEAFQQFEALHQQRNQLLGAELQHVLTIHLIKPESATTVVYELQRLFAQLAQHSPLLLETLHEHITQQQLQAAVRQQRVIVPFASWPDS